MANIKISNLPELTTPAVSDVIPVVDGATSATKKVQLDNLPISSDVQTALNLKADTTALSTKEDAANKSTNTSLGTSNTLFPTQNAVKTYVDTGLSGKQNTLAFTPENAANKSSDTGLGTSNTLYPTQAAVKSYVDNKNLFNDWQFRIQDEDPTKVVGFELNGLIPGITRILDIPNASGTIALQPEFHYGVLNWNTGLYPDMRDPNNWSNNVTNAIGRCDAASYVNLKWRIQTDELFDIGPFETVAEYANAMVGTSVYSASTVKVTPYERINPKLNNIATTGFAFNSAMMSIVKNKNNVDERRNRYYQNHDAEGAQTGNGRTFLHTLWNQCYPFLPNAAALLTEDPLELRQYQTFFKRKKDHRAAAFPFQNTTWSNGIGRYGYSATYDMFLPIGGFGTVKEIGCAVLTDFALITAEILPGSGLQKYRFRHSLTTPSVTAIKYETVQEVPGEPPGTTDTFYSILLWSHTLDRVVFKGTNLDSSLYKVDAYVIRRSGNIIRYPSVPILGGLNPSDQASPFQLDLSNINVPQEVGTLVKFRIREIATGYVSDFLPLYLKAKKIGPVIGLVAVKGNTP